MAALRRPTRVCARARLDFDSLLFAFALVLFLVTRLWGLERFPISFFGDEAIQSVTAADLAANGFTGPRGDFLPTYFENGGAFNLGVSVYAQVVPQALFGLSIFATRATSVLVALTGVAAVALILRDAFRMRAWWVGALLLSITPAWFLHSRTAFETVLAVSFYAWFLYAYLRYRSGSPSWLYVAVAAGALAFYSYSPMQVVVVSTAALLLVSDARHHRRDLGALLFSLAFAFTLAAPYLRFLLEHGLDASRHLHTLNSYLVDPDLGVGAKLGRFWDEYEQGLSPSYWYGRDDSGELVRHRMEGYGHLLLPTLPFLLAGLGVCLVRIRSSPHRAMLVALLCAPLGAALAGTNVTRALVLVVPAAVLTALGIDLALRPLGRVPWPYVATGLVAVLAAGQVFMLRDALANGPTWYRDYGLHGLQFGAREVGGALRRHLDAAPEERVVVTPTWANNTDWIVRLVTDDDHRVLVDSIESWRFERLPIPRELSFVVTTEEYETIRGDARFTSVDVLDVVPYPDGRPGFFVLRLRYSDAADAIFARERAARRRHVTETIPVDGVLADVTHPRLGQGRVADLFDGTRLTLARTLEANPFVVRIAFRTPRELSGIEVLLATMQPHVMVKITEAGGRRPLVFREELREVGTEPRVSFPLGRSVSATAVEVAVRDVRLGGDGRVHIAELAFQP